MAEEDAGATGRLQASRARSWRHRRRLYLVCCRAVVRGEQISVSSRLERLCVSTTLGNAPVVMLQPTSQMQPTTLCAAPRQHLVWTNGRTLGRTLLLSPNLASILTVPGCEVKEQEAINRAGAI